MVCNRSNVFASIAPFQIHLSTRASLYLLILKCNSYCRPVQPVTLNGGMRMPSWYDIYSLRELGVARREDEEGFERSRSLLMDLVKREMDLGIPQEKIIIGGFSQGGAVTLYSLLKSPNVKFGAALVLSSYLPMEAKAKEYFSQLNKDTPVFQTHGIDDEVVLYEYGKGTAERLKSLQMTNTTFKSYPHLGHSANDELLMEMQQFLIKNFPR